MIGDPADSLVTFITHKLDLILNLQNRLVVFHAGCVPNETLHGPRVPLLAILTKVPKLDSFFAISIYRLGSLEVLFSPSL